MTQYQYSQAIREIGNQIKLEWMAIKPDMQKMEELKLKRLRLERNRILEMVAR